MLSSPANFLKAATQGNYAIGAFNVNNMELLQGILEAAVEEQSPVIIQTSQGALTYAGMDMLGAMMHTAVRDLDIPVAIHLDHGTDPAVVEAAIDSGWYTSVMIDGSSKPFIENMRITKRIVERAHKKGIWVEAELGPIPGKEDELEVSDNASYLTDPAMVKQFVKQTGCDSLAISIGTKHGVAKFQSKPKFAHKRLAEIRKKVSVPLVLHGASGIPASAVKIAERYGADLSTARGVPNAQIKKLIAGGIGKVNIDSDLRIAFTGAVDKYMTTQPDNMDPRKYLGAGRDAVRKMVKKKLQLFGSSHTL